ncbi:AbfB domain-containing protein [Streptomyces longwoodensis]|uniref:AbfB domain-containing protein n=1 Tax=Streptomyces longwoodensis TaxID=68231 RepID=UPI0036FB4560
MPQNESRPSPHRPWEDGWAPDTTRAPGTRRLWLAGALAVATVVACVTAIALSDRPGDEASRRTTATAPTGADARRGPGLISFATPSTTATTATPAGAGPGGGPSRSTSPSPTPSPAVRHSTTATPSASSPARPTPAAPAPVSPRRSLRSVNYSDRYWHVSHGLVRLDPAAGGDARADSTFTVVPGLADRACLSLRTADGRYLRHRDFVLRAERDDGSSLFGRDATFCARPAPAASGAVSLESVNYPGRFLRHQDFRLRLDPYQDSDLYRADSAFRFTSPLAG